MVDVEFSTTLFHGQIVKNSIASGKQISFDDLRHVSLTVKPLPQLSRFSLDPSKAHNEIRNSKHKEQAYHPKWGGSSRASIQKFKKKPKKRESEGKDRRKTLLVQKGIEILFEALSCLSGNDALDW